MENSGADQNARHFQEARTWPRELPRKVNKLARQCESGIKQRAKLNLLLKYNIFHII